MKDEQKCQKQQQQQPQTEMKTSSENNTHNRLPIKFSMKDIKLFWII